MTVALTIAITTLIAIIFMIVEILFIACCLIITSWRDKDERQD